MYAIIQTGGKQYKVQPGQVLQVEKLDVDEGSVTFDQVLLCADGDDVKVGAPNVSGAKVTAEVLGVIKGDKVVAFKRRRRKDSESTRGHRQQLAQVRIDEIVPG
jgi:large subunit ribosomal protein L21